MFKNWIPSSVFLAFLFFTVFSCNLIDVEEVEIAENDRELAISLLTTSISIEDLLEEFVNTDDLQIDAENFVTVVYQSEELTGRSDTLVQLEDFPILVVSNEMEISPEDFNFENKINRIELKEGFVSYSMQNFLPLDITVNMNLLDVKKSGNPLTWSFTVPAASGTVTGTIDMANYEIDLSEDFSITYTATFPNGQMANVSLILLEFSDLDYKYIEGNFEGSVLSVPSDSLFYEIFDGTTEGMFSIEEPTLTLNFSNSYGIPFRLVADTFKTETLNGGVLDFETPLDEGFDFAYPNLNQRGQYASSKLVINKDNSNLPQIISELPYRFDYQFNAIAFPDDDTTTIGFVLDDSEFKVNMEFEMPLFGRASGLSFEDVYDFDGNDLDDAKEIEIKIVAQNQIPAELGIQLSFEDNNGDVLETLLDLNDLIFEPAEIDEYGKSTGAVNSEKLITVSPTELANIKKSEKVRMTTFISTLNEGNDPIRVHTDYKIDLQIGVKVIPL